MSEAKTLWAVVGEQLRTARETNSWRQEDLASQARLHGLNWRRATVAAVEAGDRGVGIEELILLSVLFGQPLSWWVTGHGLTPAEESDMVQLTPDAAAPRLGLAFLLKGESPAETPADIARPDRRRRLQMLHTSSQWDTQAARWSRSLEDHFEDERRRAVELWPKVTNRHLVTIRLTARQDAEMKAARTLQLSPFDVATLAVEKWGHGLTAERDKRVGELGQVDARSAQARRGHVTRALVAELRSIKEERGL